MKYVKATTFDMSKGHQKLNLLSFSLNPGHYFEGVTPYFTAPFTGGKPCLGGC